MSAPLWRTAVIAPCAHATAFEAALVPWADTLSALRWGDHAWRLEGLSAIEPDRSAVELALALAAASAGVPPPEITIEPLTERDWLADNRERFAAVRIGRFLIQQPEDGTPVPPGHIRLRIEAATAFGSGRHGSTEGCLLAMQMLAHRPIRRVLDLGCGSGILAIAAAKLWRIPVLATDVDSGAVAVTRANARLNGVGPKIRVVVADGPFDLVLCNILARPLKRLTTSIARNLMPGGIAVLAGFLLSDGNDVLTAYRTLGLRLVHRIDVEGWRTLVLERPARTSPATTSETRPQGRKPLQITSGVP